MVVERGDPALMVHRAGSHTTFAFAMGLQVYKASIAYVYGHEASTVKLLYGEEGHSWTMGGGWPVLVQGRDALGSSPCCHIWPPMFGSTWPRSPLPASSSPSTRARPSARGADCLSDMGVLWDAGMEGEVSLFLREFRAL
jgi:hypothetical protein